MASDSKTTGMKIPTNPHMIHLDHQRVLRVVHECAVAAPKGSFAMWYSPVTKTGALAHPIYLLTALGLAERSGTGWCLTDLGWQVHDDMLARYPDRARLQTQR